MSVSTVPVVVSALFEQVHCPYYTVPVVISALFEPCVAPYVQLWKHLSFNRASERALMIGVKEIALQLFKANEQFRHLPTQIRQSQFSFV